MSRVSLHKILVLSLILVLGSSISLYNLVLLPKTNGATCMDGSAAGFYTYTPDDETPLNKLLIYFEDIWEGWCVKENLNDSIAHCQKYVNDTNYIDFGSSNNWGGSFIPFSGIMSLNSIFSAWPKAWIKSCDGGSYFSDSSVVIKNKTLNFRGAKNVQETINYLIKNNLLTNRQDVLLVGTGNGALAALAWADYVQANTKGKVRVLSDAGIWENQLQQKTQSPVFQNRMKSMDKLFLNGKAFPNMKCQTANQNNIHKCFYASQLTKYIIPAVQIMFLQSYYDGWQAAQILRLNCTEQFGSLSECTTQHRQVIQDYHKKISTSLVQLTKLPNVSAFGIACVAHFFTNGKWDNTDYSVPMNSNNTAQEMVQKWSNSKSSSEKFVSLDSVEWPNNKICSHQVKGSNLLTQ